MLRPIEPEDADRIARAAGTTDTDRVASLIQNSALWWRSHGYGVWVVLDSEGDQALGWYGLRPIPSPSTPELLFGLARHVQGQGLATEAGRAVLNHVFKVGAVTLVWGATVPANKPSIGVMERIGMQFESRKDLDGVDSVIYKIKKSAESQA